MQQQRVRTEFPCDPEEPETKAQQGLNPESWQKTDGSSGGWAAPSWIGWLVGGYYEAANSFSVPSLPGGLISSSGLLPIWEAGAGAKQF